MSAMSYGVLEGEGVIVSPKKTPEQMKFRWDPDLIQEVRDIAEQTGRTINETGEMLMRWAVERAKAELELSGSPEGIVAKRKKA